MPKIHKLSPNLADMIAAGEVVERPASVIKELVENAVDAGAGQITVEIQNGGVTFMRVTDDGCGMSAEDAPTAFLRHATSKISTAEDLSAITTMGFRGEALAAISAVSKIDLLTKSRESELGVSVRVEAGNVLDVSPAGCPQGTTIIVRNLFYNTPARMKFLKRDSTEGSYIAGAVQRQALAHPEIGFRFIRDGKPELSTPGDGKLLSAIYAAMGRQVARELVEVRGTYENVTVQGYVGKPTASRGSRGYQHFFVNGRYVRSKVLTAALEEAYQNQMMVGRFPVCVLHVSVAPTAVDVNVHPAKTEVKFLRERDVFDAVRYLTEGTLNRTQDRPEMTLKETKPQAAAQPSGGFYQTMSAKEYRAAQEQPKGSTLSRSQQAAAGSFREILARQAAQKTETVLRDSVRLAPGPNGPVPIPPTLIGTDPKPIRPASGPQTSGGFHPRAEQPAEQPVPAEARPVVQPDAQEMPPEQMNLEMPPMPVPKAPEQAPASIVEQKPEQPPYRIIGQTMDTYIIVEQGDTLLFFDKHAAHERILFEKLRAQDHEIMSQVLLTPLQVHLAEEESALLLEHRDALEPLGFELEDYGEGTVLLRAIPSDVDQQDAPACLSEIAQALSEGKRLSPDKVLDEILHTVACKAAIKGGQYSDPRELEALVAELMSRDDIQHCPHGRPVCITLTKGQLERQFKRT